MGDRGTPSCYDDGKALDSCLQPRAEAANVGAVFNLPPPWPGALTVGKRGLGAGGGSLHLLREDICRPASGQLPESGKRS